MAGAISCSRFMVPYSSSIFWKPITLPGTPTALKPNRLRLGMTLPLASRYMFSVAAAGAFSRKSMKVSLPLARWMVAKPPPPILPQHGWVTASA